MFVGLTTVRMPGKMVYRSVRFMISQYGTKYEHKIMLIELEYETVMIV